MNFSKISAGENLPYEFNVIIEISMHSDPIKYEIDKTNDVILVDRFILTDMRYPCNYGYIPQTLSDDGDPLDVLLIAPFPIQIGAVIKSRAIGMLAMEDESGSDAKILALPNSKICPIYENIKTYLDLPKQEISKIEHFFQHYKDLEKNKWVKILGWQDINSAHLEIEESIKKYKNN